MSDKLQVFDAAECQWGFRGKAPRRGGSDQANKAVRAGPVGRDD